MYFKSGYRRELSRLYRKLPEGIILVLDVLRSYGLTLLTSRPIFVHIPKNGGVSVSNALYGRDVIHLKVRDLRKVLRFFGRRQIVCVVRDPLYRFVSAANFLRTGGTKDRSVDYRNVYTDVDFDDLSSILDMVRSSKDSDLDPIFRKQVYYLDQLNDVDIYGSDKISLMLRNHFNIEKTVDRYMNVSEKYFSVGEVASELKDKIYSHYEEDKKLYEAVINERK